jgi:SAM-dependent methyltransferase/FKBP-type peptidyl-prolyl cis-trans isomerase 2
MPLQRILQTAAEVATTDRPAERPRLEQTTSKDMTSLLCTLQWQCERAAHTDIRLLPKFNMWRDILPPELEPGLMDKPVGQEASHSFAAGELLAPYQADQCFDIPNESFQRRHGKRPTEPRAGRFYPRGYIAGVQGIFAEERSPFRVGQVSDAQLTVDLNHPLAERAMTLSARVLDAWPAGDEHGGRCNEVAELVCAEGPGMPARWRGQPTDFWSGNPFYRIADEPDEFFYSMPRMVQHLDAHCRAALAGLHGDLIAPNSRVLDLMASLDSHLPEDLALASVNGLGMSAEELDANPRLSDYVVHDLNDAPSLPYADASFDAVICTASVEYLIHPAEVFAEISRVLAPGGLALMTFSDRWFDPKVIDIWQDIHAFERPGLVLDYLQNAGFGDLHTLSLRALPRPVDDKYAYRLAESDPLFAVWGHK